MNRLPLTALRALAAVYEAGGVRPAARTLKVSHSSVSRHLAELEAWIGVSLLEKKRGGKSRFALTPQGNALGKAALEGLSALTNAVDGVRELRRANSVVIATTASFAARWLIPRLAALHKAYAWIDVSVVTQQHVQTLSEQGADLAIRMGSGPWSDGNCEPLMDDQLYPVATREYWRALGERQAARALAKARLLHDRDPAATWERWFAVHPAANIDLRAGGRFTSSDLVLRAAAEGLGIALARHQLVTEDIATGRLFRPLGNAAVAITRAYWVVRPEGEELRPALKTVLQWLRSSR